MRRLLPFLAALVTVLAGCADSGPFSESGAPPIPDVPASDLEVFDSGKADGAVFDANHLVSDAVFTDWSALSVADVQSFFERTPYGHRSFLADYQEDGRSAAEHLVAAARRNGLNPLVFLVKLQVEMGLVSRTDRPSTFRLAHAMGCACPDGLECDSSEAGFSSQLDCAGRLFSSYLDDLADGGATLTGWRAAVGRRSEDRVWVTPANAATAALYTYTPWVLPRRGGNWLFWNVLQRYRQHLGQLEPNSGWIGGACDGDQTCDYAGGFCLHGPADGLCTLGCDRFCPDASSPNVSTTFCADLGAMLGTAPDGYCLSRCAPGLYPDNAGCRAGFRCAEAPRFGEPSFRTEVCWPLPR